MAQHQSQKLIEHISTLRVENTVDLALLALVVYEHLITSQREVRTVWYQRFGLYSALLVINRYCTLLWVIMSVASDNTLSGCYIWMRLVEWTEACLILTSAVLAAARAYAVSAQRYRIMVALLVLGLGLVVVAECLYESSQSTPLADPLLGHCAKRTSITQFVESQLSELSMGCNISADVSLLAVIWINTSKSWRMNKIQERGASVSEVIMRDGMLYFGALLALNIAKLVFFFASGHLVVAPFVVVLRSILSSRFILNLRWQDHKACCFPEVSTKSVQFANVQDEWVHTSTDENDDQDTIDIRASDPQPQVPGSCVSLTFPEVSAPDDQLPDSKHIGGPHHNLGIV